MKANQEELREQFEKETGKEACYNDLFVGTSYTKSYGEWLEAKLLQSQSQEVEQSLDVYSYEKTTESVYVSPRFNTYGHYIDAPKFQLYKNKWLIAEKVCDRSREDMFEEEFVLLVKLLNKQLIPYQEASETTLVSALKAIECLCDSNNESHENIRIIAVDAIASIPTQPQKEGLATDNQCKTFSPDPNYTSATICRFCGKEKYSH